MTDFYTILRSAIEEAGANTADARATIYLRAWAALEAQFDDSDIALPDEARKAQRALMDEAIARIEAEFGAPVPQSAGAPEAPGGAATGSGAEGRQADEAATPGTLGGAVPEEAAPLAGSATGAPLSMEARAPKAGRRRGGTLAALILFIVVLAGAAGVAYWLWDDLKALIADASQGETQGETMTGAEPAGERGEDAAAPASDAPRDGEAAAPAATGRAPADTDAEADTGADALQRGEAAAPSGKSDRAAGTAGQDGFAKDEDRVGGEARAATERGFLVLEPEEPGKDDLRLAGTSRWSVEGQGMATSLNIDVQIPERGESLRLTMRANRDEALPASHTVDLIHQGPSGAATLAEVIGIMAIEDKIETAQPLRAAGALVVPDQYLLALRGALADRRENVARLRSAQWLAVRTVLNNGRHAVFVIEIGKSGAAVLEEALAAWGDAPAETAPADVAQ